MLSNFYTLGGTLLTDPALYNKLDFSGIYISHRGYKFYRLNGYRHRLDGPAIEYNSGSKEWWVDGKEITEEQSKILNYIMRKGAL